MYKLKLKIVLCFEKLVLFNFLSTLTDVNNKINVYIQLKILY